MKLQNASSRSAPLSAQKNKNSVTSKSVQPGKPPNVASKAGLAIQVKYHRDGFDDGGRGRLKSHPSNTKALGAKGQGAQATAGTGPQTEVTLPGGNNNASITQTKQGLLRITSNQQTVTLTAEQSRGGVIIRAGDGNDTVKVSSKVTIGLTIDGGRGNDTLRGGSGHDTLIGGKGDDYLNGGRGSDVMRGDAGRDVLYGLDGDDRLDGGSGRDYQDGGNGDDALLGGSGADQLLGGVGTDVLSGGIGNDALAGGDGQDTLHGEGGRDTLYLQKDDSIQDGRKDRKRIVDMGKASGLGKSIRLSGNGEYKAQVRSDLDALRSLPTGQRMLRGLDASGKHTTIKPTLGISGASARGDVQLRPDGSRAPGANAQVRYNATLTDLKTFIPQADKKKEWLVMPPSVGLFHELAHAHDFVNGELDPGHTGKDKNAELSATGLPYQGRPSRRPSENDLRAELNLPRRTSYGV